MNELNRYSQTVLDALQSALPEVCAEASLEIGDDDTFLMTLPPRSAGIQYGLRISTEGDEVTVGVHLHHTHFSEYDPDPEEHIGDAIEHVKALLAEELVIDTWYNDDDWVATGSHAASTPLGSEAGAPSATRVSRRSWLGTHDAELELVQED